MHEIGYNISGITDMESYAFTHQGLKREENQDRFFIREFNDRSLIMAVADGMGGEAGGGQAAQIAIEAVKEFNPHVTAVEVSLQESFQAAAQRIGEEVQKDPRLKGMGTTLTTAYIKNEDAYWYHTGDSRLYLFRAGHLTQITEDHTFVQELVKDGVITKEAASVHPLQNILLHCVGCEPLEVSSGKFNIFEGDWVFLCTDGLYHEVREEKIVSILTRKINIRKKFERLVQAALEAGGKDNITITGVKI